ncbi:MAG: hypothetical protein K1X53_06800 [Candidatus Sumerlaeaceae bacterium]|nr:hypothetical protein [Candidatus Sumerlaeaceae bacterium]
MNHALTTLFAAAALLGTIAAPAQPPPNPNELVTASAILDTAAIEAGKPFHVGLLLKVKYGATDAEKWHVYWSNPGESGMPTTVQWTSGTSGTIAAVQYPAPEMFKSPGNIVSYGYDREVLLISEAKYDKLPEGMGYDFLKAQVSFLVCSGDQCVPGKASTIVRVPFGKAAPANTEIFDKYKALLPKDGPTTAAKAVIAKSDEGFKVTVTVDAASTPMVGDGSHKLAFFPDLNEGFETSVPKTPAPDGKVGTAVAYTKSVTIEYTIKPEEKGNKTEPKASGVLVFQPLDKNGAAQPVQAYKIQASKGE